MSKKNSALAETNETLLEQKLGYVFSNQSTLRLALTHRSLGTPCNERLEFLGDAILAQVISEILYAKYPAMNEGELSCIRSSLVSKPVLVSCAKAIELLPHILVGQAERKGSCARSRNSVMANALEAIIGAVYLDGGLSPCRAMIARLYGEKLENSTCSKSFKDAKSQLQELSQSRYRNVPYYQLIATRGKPHDRIFVVSCTVVRCDEKFIGEAPSRKGADQAAAAIALKYLLPN